jgi:hypothetical protein
MRCDGNVDVEATTNFARRFLTANEHHDLRIDHRRARRIARMTVFEENKVRIVDEFFSKIPKSWCGADDGLA